jgi:(p)ppGpp synthase/HD superfamily hydrolase
MQTPSFEDTVRFIQIAHEGQTDKSGVAYWKHPVAVAAIVKTLYDGSEDEILAALLHDVVEDTGETLEDLAQRGYSRITLDIVRWVSGNLTRTGTYLDWIRHIAENGPLGAVKVKLADNEHNTRPGHPGGESTMQRYKRSMAILKQALETRTA